MLVYILLIISIITSIILTIAITKYNKKKIKEYDERLKTYKDSYREKNFALMELITINQAYMRDISLILSNYMLPEELFMLQLGNLEIPNIKPKYVTEFSENDKEHIEELKNDINEIIELLLTHKKYLISKKES